MVYPVVLGAGDRLFDHSTAKQPTRLLDTRTIGTSLAYLTYEFIREP